jgi:DNA-binding transcriptional MerR regulator/quercetin dioxygenase-like cupin family protein
MASIPSNALLMIGQAAASIGVSPGTLRLWEAEGLIFPARDSAGTRRYDERDLLQLRQIWHMRTVDRLNAPAIRKVLGRPEAGTAKSAADTRGGTPHDFRGMRRRAGITLKEAARRAGLSVSFVSALERGLVGASPGTVSRLLAAYGEAGPWFDSRDQTIRVLHAGEGKSVRVGAEVENRWLTEDPGLLEVIHKTLEPGASSGGTVDHDGEELIYVLRGQLEVRLEEKAHLLHGGDSLYFPSHLTHRWENPGPATSEVLWVSTEVGLWSGLGPLGRSQDPRRAMRPKTLSAGRHVEEDQ